MRTLSFIVDGKPEHWRRARYNPHQQRFFMDKRTKAGRDRLAAASKTAVHDQAWPMIEGRYVHAFILFYFPKPKVRSKHLGEIERLEMPDLDNLIKLVLDAMNGIAYVDDKLVTRVEAAKFEDDDDPRTEITLRS